MKKLIMFLILLMNLVACRENDCGCGDIPLNLQFVDVGKSGKNMINKDNKDAYKFYNKDDNQSITIISTYNVRAFTTSENSTFTNSHNYAYYLEISPSLGKAITNEPFKKRIFMKKENDDNEHIIEYEIGQRKSGSLMLDYFKYVKLDGIEMKLTEINLLKELKNTFERIGESGQCFF